LWTTVLTTENPSWAYETHGDFVATLRNGRVFSVNASNTAIISEENYLIEELSFQWVPEGQLGHNTTRYLNRRHLVNPEDIREPSLGCWRAAQKLIIITL
jgi:hypothetical protein